MAMLPRFIQALSALTVVSLLAACSGGGNSGGGQDGPSQEGVTIELADAPVDSAKSLTIYVSGLFLQPQGQGTLNQSIEPIKAIDLLELQGGKTEALISNLDLPTGGYDWVRLVLDREQPPKLVMQDNNEYTLNVPDEIYLKANQPFTVPANGDVTFILDFDVRKSLLSDGSGGYQLRPDLRLVAKADAGRVFGGVDVAAFEPQHEGCDSSGDPDYAGALYIYAGQAATLGELGTDSEPFSVAPVRLAGDDSPDVGSFGYYYAGYHLPAGDYTLAYTCDVDEPGQADDLTFSSPRSITVTAGQATQTDFEGLAN
ncbi:DUF4382 domain-containing protein [Marinobacteraceae bacterium S3BR75-40.1]